MTKPKIPGGGQYKKLCAIVATRPSLSLEIGGNPPDDLVLQLWQRRNRRKAGEGSNTNMLLVASAPFEPGGEDQAAKDIADRASVGTLHL